MHSRALIGVFAGLVACTTAYASGPEREPVSPFAQTITYKRVNDDVLFRYVEFVQDYPCLRLETFVPESRKRIDKKEICKFLVGDRTVDVSTEPLAAVIHENFMLDTSTFSFSTEVIFIQQGSYYADCKVTISPHGRLSEPSCTQGEPPPYSEK